jgi:hypothetical protein
MCVDKPTDFMQDWVSGFCCGFLGHFGGFFSLCPSPLPYKAPALRVTSFQIYLSICCINANGFSG